MMPETVQEMMSGRKVRVARLFRFEFLSATKRFWDGRNILTAGGQEWEGSADVISVSGIEYAENLAATPATFTLSGTTPDLIYAAAHAENEVARRPCAVFLQFLSESHAPLDSPVAIWSGLMDTLEFSGDVGNQKLSMNAETLFVDRVLSPWGLMTDPDQKTRWPDDDIFEFAPMLRNKTTNWLRG